MFLRGELVSAVTKSLKSMSVSFCYLQRITESVTPVSRRKAVIVRLAAIGCE